MDTMLYKYRSLDYCNECSCRCNLKRIEDIFLNNQMYASKFEKLNDQMEGAYFYSHGELSSEFQSILYTNKNKYRILCLSEENNNSLLWSHYANGHSGIAIGITVKKPNIAIPVEYVSDKDFSEILTNASSVSSADELAKKLLMRKLDLWKYEREQRVLIESLMPAEQFVSVEIREVWLGVKTSDKDEKWVRKIVNDCLGKSVTISKMDNKIINPALFEY